MDDLNEISLTLQRHVSACQYRVANVVASMDERSNSAAITAGYQPLFASKNITLVKRI